MLGVMPHRTVIRSLLAAAACLALLAVPALAQTLSERVVDEAGVLSSGDVGAATDAI
jgi:uncharacterized membrane protein YgcG